MGTKPVAYVLVVGHGPSLESDEGVATMLRTLGSQVTTMDLWDDFARLARDGELAAPRAIVFDAGDRPDLAQTALRAARRESAIASAPAILAVPARQVAGVEPSSGFDDFIVMPCTPTELYARIRALEWRRSEFSNE